MEHGGEVGNRNWSHKNKDFPCLPFKKPSEEEGSREVRLFSIRCLTTCVSGGNLEKTTCASVISMLRVVQV